MSVVRYSLSLLYLFTLVAIFLVSAMISFAGTLEEDFEDGDAEGWERSPQNEDNDDVFWDVVDGEMVFDPQGQAWDMAISQMNFVGVPGSGNVEEWTDYDLEVDIKHTEMANYPGGIRGRVNLETGGHYAIWFYPGNSNIKLYKNPGWDINTGLSELGVAPYKPDVDEFHTVKLSCQGDSITVFLDGDEIISAQDDEHKTGTVALCVQDKVVHFDNIKVTGPGITSLKMSPVKPEEKLATTWGMIKE